MTIHQVALKLFAQSVGWTSAAQSTVALKRWTALRLSTLQLASHLYGPSGSRAYAYSDHLLLELRRICVSQITHQISLFFVFFVPFVLNLFVILAFVINIGAGSRCMPVIRY